MASGHPGQPFSFWTFHPLGEALVVNAVLPLPPTVVVADPDRGPRFTAVRLVDDSDDYLHADLPALHAWQIVLIRY